MNRHAFPLAAVLALFWSATAGAQDQPAEGLRLSGSMRLRYEAVDGQVRPGFNASDDLVNLRTTLFAEYRRGPFRAGGEIYDSRVWGGNGRTPVTTNEVNTLEPVQAYLGWDGRAGPLNQTSVQAGRFLLNVGSRRLLASDDYRNTINSYQGVRIDMAPAGVTTTLLYFRPVTRLPEALPDLLANRYQADRADEGIEVWAGIAAKPGAVLGATPEVTYVRFQEDDRPGHPTRDRRLDTYGGRLVLPPAPGRWNYEVEGLLQTGAISAGLAAADRRIPVLAGMAHASAGYTFAGHGSPRLSLLFDWISGDQGGARFGRFDTLFGTRRAEFSVAGLYSAISRANMVAPGVRLEMAPRGAPWDGLVTIRPLWAQSGTDAFSTTGVRDPTGRSGTYAGTEIEGRLRWQLIRDRLRAEMDWAYIAKGRLLTAAPNAPASGGAERYISFNLQAQF